MKSVVAVLAGLLVSGVCASGVLSAEPSNTDLAEQIKELKSEVAALKAQAASPATAPSAVGQAPREQFLALNTPSPTSGWDKGLFLQSQDKRITLKPGFMVQFRHITNWRQDAKNGGADDDIQNGFEVRRTRMWMEGNVYGPDILYRLGLDNSSNASGIVLEDAFIGYKLNDAWFIKAGQFKPPVTHEEFGITDLDQPAVERSLLNDTVGQTATVTRAQGISALWKNQKDSLHVTGMISDGEGSSNTNFEDQATPDTRARFGAFGRLEYKFKGQWADHALGTAKGTKEETFVLSVGLNTTEFPRSDIYRGEVVAHYTLASKWNLLASLAGALTEPRNTGVPTRFDYGGLIEVSRLLNPMYEVFGRYDVTIQDADLVKSENVYPEIAVGINRYLGTEGAAGNSARITLDLNYLPNGVPSNRTGLGYLENIGKNEFVARLQFQIKI